MRAFAQRTQAIWFFLVFMLAGYGLSGAMDMQAIRENPYYPLALNLLLGVGLYASVRGIDHSELKGGKGDLLAVVTLGVALKIAIIGGIIYFFTGRGDAFMFAIVVAQIDPLSISALTLKSSYQLSPKARTFLLTWASFDDPITVIAAIVVAQYVFFVDLTVLSQDWYWQLGNVIFPALVYGVYFFACKDKNRPWLEICLLFGAGAISILFGWMLSVALMGLFLRPGLFGLGDVVVPGAYMLSLVLLGSYLTSHVELGLGVTLALAAIGSQAVTSFTFMARLPWQDKVYLACAQQNGITAVILALLFVRATSAAADVIPVVVVAIIVINLVHITAFYLLDNYAGSKSKTPLGAEASNKRVASLQNSSAE
jgi:hypothetical protein